MASTTSADDMPSGSKIFTTVPEVFFIPELVFGGLVWILVATNHVTPPNPMAWVMVVSLFCFDVTSTWFFLCICGENQSSCWPGLDAGFHFLAAVFYLSASVLLAYITIWSGDHLSIYNFRYYIICISASVMSFIATLLYFLHAICSAIRWRRSYKKPSASTI